MSDPKPYNFIVADLCDNDFGQKLKSALEEGVDEYGHLDGGLCPTLWKKFLIAYILGDQMKRVNSTLTENFNWDALKQTEAYLREQLTVTFEQKEPEQDHDGGSACLNVHTKATWTY